MTLLRVVRDVKQRICELVDADVAFRDTRVLYHDPRKTEEKKGPTGAHELVFWVPDSAGTIERASLGIGEHELAGTITLRLEIMDVESDADRSKLENRALELADDVIAVLAAETSIGLGAEWRGLTVRPSGYALESGHLQKLPGQGVGLNLAMAFEYSNC